MTCTDEIHKFPPPSLLSSLPPLSLPPLHPGDEPMRHRQLAVKKVPISEAKMVVADIIVCRGRDSVSKLYRRLE